LGPRPATQGALQPAALIKERLGFGSVHKVKDKNALLLVIAARKGLEKVINLINGKIRTVGGPIPFECPTTWGASSQ
jgi:hypothetical protein